MVWMLNKEVMDITTGMDTDMVMDMDMGMGIMMKIIKNLKRRENKK